MSDVREAALARIAAMAARPRIWAASREAFGLQLVLLVEIGRGRLSSEKGDVEAMHAVFGPGPTIGEGYDDAWARQAAAAARMLIERSARHPSAQGANRPALVGSRSTCCATPARGRRARVECETCLGSGRIRDGGTDELRRCLNCGGSGVR